MGGRIAILLALCCSTGYAEEIPLSEVWGYGLPGTRDISRLEAQFFTDKFKSRPVGESYEQFKQNSFVHRIRQLLGSRPSTGTQPGFAVEGSGLEALRHAFEVMNGTSPTQYEFLAHGDISLFIFSYRASSFIRIESIVQGQNSFHIRAVHLPHETLQMTEHFALIPAGDLPPGRYRVSIDWYDSNGKKVISDDRYICQSFSFTVSERPKE